MSEPRELDIMLRLDRKSPDVEIGLQDSMREINIAMEGGGGYARAMVNTTEYWEQKPTYVPYKGLIIVYSDYATTVLDGKTVNVPGMKIGDGSAYLIDLPFIGDNMRSILEEHIHNAIVHVTQEEKDFWNAKLNCEFQNEQLILNRR